ncbi:hypothetical protein D918_08979 [Trichuris suis]|nr:hypothetical protein D918_08979 [Trichuris suis]
MTHPLDLYGISPLRNRAALILNDTLTGESQPRQEEMNLCKSVTALHERFSKTKLKVAYFGIVTKIRHSGGLEVERLFKNLKLPKIRHPKDFHLRSAQVCVTLSSCADSRRPTSPVRLNLEDPTDRQCAPNGPKTSLSDASDDSENSAYAEEDSDVDVRGSTGLCMPSGCHRLQVNNSLDDESASLNNRPSTLQGEQPNAPCYPGSTMFGGSAWVSDGAADLTVDVGVTPTSISV